MSLPVVLRRSTAAVALAEIYYKVSIHSLLPDKRVMGGISRAIRLLCSQTLKCDRGHIHLLAVFHGLTGSLRFDKCSPWKALARRLIGARVLVNCSRESPQASAQPVIFRLWILRRRRIDAYRGDDLDRHQTVVG